MKPKHLFHLALYFICFSSSAQSGKFNVGVDVYPNYSVRSGDSYNNFDYKSKPSISFGVALTYQLSRKMSFESGFKYSNKGHRRTSDNNIYFDYYYGYGYPFSPAKKTDYKYNYNYLSIPLNIRLALSENANKGWYVRFGFAAELYVSSYIITKAIELDDTVVKGKQIDDDNIRKTHLNLNYGIGYSFLIEDEYQISVEPAFEYMFYKIFHKGLDEVYNSIGLKVRFMIL